MVSHGEVLHHRKVQVVQASGLGEGPTVASSSSMDVEEVTAVLAPIW